MEHKLEVHEALNIALEKHPTPTSFKPYQIAKEAYRHGFVRALEEFGIWKDGVRTIGCMQTDIKEIIKELDEQLGAGEKANE